MKDQWFVKNNNHGVKLEPIKADKESLNLLYMKIANMKYKTNGSRILLSWLKSTATELIKELKKEYRLE